MHTHYYAVCDEHKEMAQVLVTSTFHIRTDLYLNVPENIDKNGNVIVQWLDKHYGCEKRLLYNDQFTDEMWDTYKRLK